MTKKDFMDHQKRVMEELNEHIQSVESFDMKDFQRVQAEIVERIAAEAEGDYQKQIDEANLPPYVVKKIESLNKVISKFGGSIGATKIERVLRFFPILVNDDLDEIEKQEAATNLFSALDDESRVGYCYWSFLECKNNQISRAVWSKILIAGHQEGKLGSLLSALKQSVVIRMFKLAEASYLMEEQEYRRFLNLPNEFTIYRGGAGVSVDKLKNGICWTTNIDQAAWFADRFSEIKGEGVVIEATVKKENIFGCFDYEDEVIVHKSFFGGCKVLEVKVCSIGIKEAAKRSQIASEIKQDKMVAESKVEMEAEEIV